MAYTVISNPMPGPLCAAMDDLLQHDARVAPDGVYPDAEGHHLIARSGTLAVHAVLALDHYEDGVAWADSDLTWTATLDGQPVQLKRWSDVCAAVRSHAPGKAGT